MVPDAAVLGMVPDAPVRGGHARAAQAVAELMESDEVGEGQRVGADVGGDHGVQHADVLHART